MNFHAHGELDLNHQRTAYQGGYPQGGVHNPCLAPLVSASMAHPDRCAICKGEISNPFSASILAVYQSREKGCTDLASLQDACFRDPKVGAYPFLKP